MDKAPSRQQGIADSGRLDAIVVLLAALVRGMVTNKAHVKAAEDKAVLALGQTGMPQAQVAKLLGIDILRVNVLLRKRVGARSKNTPAKSEAEPSESS